MRQETLVFCVHLRQKNDCRALVQHQLSVCCGCNPGGRVSTIKEVYIDLCERLCG